MDIVGYHRIYINAVVNARRLKSGGHILQYMYESVVLVIRRNASVVARVVWGGSLCPSVCPDVPVRCFTTVRTSYYRYLSCIRLIYHI